MSRSIKVGSFGDVDPLGDAGSFTKAGSVVEPRSECKAAASPTKADSFSAALMLIASLPLSDAEKAEALRRLMAEWGEDENDV